MVTSHVISAELSNNRLDHVLRRLYPDTPRRTLLLWLDQGAIKLDGRVGRKGQLVVAGQELTVMPVAPDQTAPGFQLSILLESNDVVVLDKPAGQASTSLEGGSRHSVADLLLDHYPQMLDVGHGVRDAGLVHRLDTGTSGVLVAAKSRSAFETLTQALRNGELHKLYLAWTNGTLPHERGSIELALTSDPRNRRRVIAATRRGQSTHPSHVTHYEVLNIREGISLVRLSAPVATRHQIRAHLASIGCPLLGDPLYGGPRHPELKRHALHASRVSYRGTAGCSPFDCVSPPPDDVRNLVPFVWED